MSGLSDLVPLAELLADIAGGRKAAIERAVLILCDQRGSVPRAKDDLSVSIREEMVRTGIVTDTYGVSMGRAAELVEVCEILAACRVKVQRPSPEPRLVLTAPEGSISLEDAERLDAFVIDVIRCARRTLHIGGAFWNQRGFDELCTVLLPALEARDVAVKMYANPHAAEFRQLLARLQRSSKEVGDLGVRWFRGSEPTMLHAKFVIRDGEHGYLGSANFTSWGMHGHIEAGVELSRAQRARFIKFLDDLEAAGLFSAAPSPS